MPITNNPEKEIRTYYENDIVRVHIGTVTQSSCTMPVIVVIAKRI